MVFCGLGLMNEYLRCVWLRIRYFLCKKVKLLFYEGRVASMDGGDDVAIVLYMVSILCFHLEG